jgi:hypothetical protein
MCNRSILSGLGILIGGLITLNSGCETQSEVAPTTGKPTAVVGSSAEPAAVLKKEPATRVLVCQGSENSAGKSVYYAADFMTRRLQRYPTFAEYAGLKSVSSCNEASTYVRAYEVYSKQKPNFEDETEPGTSTNASAVKQRSILPRTKILNGNQLVNWGYPSQSDDAAMSPIVYISQVNWLKNGTLDPVRIKVGTDADGNTLYANEFGEPAGACTGTFLNRHWILTAAHCMAAVELQSVFSNPQAPDGGPYLYVQDGGQPGDPYALHQGPTSYVIWWPSHVAGEEFSERTTIYGLTAYQFPHPGYDNQEQDLPTAEHYRGHTPDIALLYLPPWNQDDNWFLAPDVSKGSAVYIKAEEADGEIPTTLNFQIAGFGPNPVQLDTITKDDAGRVKRRLYGAPAPASLRLADSNFPYGKFGGALAVLGDNDAALCHGDSGGPLYVNLAEDPFETPKIVQYGIATAMYQQPPGEDKGPAIGQCSSSGNANGWMRLEKTKDVIDWINQKMEHAPAIARDATQQQSFNQCKRVELPTVGWVYQCWGEPCSSSGDCEDDETCEDAGADLDKNLQFCNVCPDPDPNKDQYGCACVKGQCVADPSKQPTLDAGPEEAP